MTLFPPPAAAAKPRSRRTRSTPTGRSKLKAGDGPLVALDIASRTGWAVVCTRSWRLLGWGAWAIRQDGASLLPGLIRLERRVSELIEAHRPGLVGIERPFLRGGDPSVVTGSMVRVVVDACYLAGVPTKLVSPPEWRAQVLGNGSAKKPAAVAYARRLSGDQEIGEDAAEAVCVADHFARMLRSL